MRLFVIVLIVGILASCGQQDKAPAANTSTTISADAGKEIFMQSCASCHSIKNEMIGPPLAGVEQRWSDKQKLYAFIKNAPEVIKTDAYAKQLWEKYNKTFMQPFPDLQDKDIDAILAYINEQSK